MENAYLQDCAENAPDHIDFEIVTSARDFVAHSIEDGIFLFFLFFLFFLLFCKNHS